VLNKELNDEVCDATEDDATTAVGYILIQLDLKELVVLNACLA